MFKSKNFLLLALAFVVVGCANKPLIGMANPSSVYCEEVGGKNIIKNDVGYCELPGRTIESWELYQAKERFNKP